jgi:hypothetical protein
MRRDMEEMRSGTKEETRAIMWKKNGGKMRHRPSLNLLDPVHRSDRQGLSGRNQRVLFIC